MLTAARKAGDVLMAEFGNSDLGMETKLDGSPVLRADLASNEALIKELNNLLPIPVLSEESNSDTFPNTDDGRYFIIDPLDGTKEFMKGSQDFAVNIAYLENNEPVIGLIYAPATGIGYTGAVNEGAWLTNANGTIKQINVSDRQKKLVGITSVSHVSDADNVLLGRLGCTEIKRQGSALKFCAVASGAADVYVRHGRTMIWDTVAAHALIKYAGGQLYYAYPSLTTEFRKSFENPGFICINHSLQPAEEQAVQEVFHG